MGSAGFQKFFYLDKIILVSGIFFLVLFLQACGNAEQPQEAIPMKEIPLDNLDSFRQAAGNWRITGAVKSNRTREHNLRGLEGKGILLNSPDEEERSHLVTKWTHGDLELELDFLMPKGSNSGIYLMGRYEIQLFDSWGEKEPGFSDLGGIYQRWDEDRPKGDRGFEGHAPLMNAARAPGLWQHVKIIFKAPEFNKRNKKISDAVFKKVWLNGILVQENREVSGPTRAALFDDEQAEGPLMIQGDHGPVAVRNIRYKRYDKKDIRLDDLSYDYYADSLDQFSAMDRSEVAESGVADSLSGRVVSKDERFALRYTGTLQAPNDGTYLFKLQNAGKVRMLIDDEVIFEQERYYRMHETAFETAELEGGRHDFMLEYINHHNDWYWGLALSMEGPRLRQQKLHAASSVPGSGAPVPDLLVEVDDRVKVLRSFAMHHNAKRTHVVNVGAPNEISYSYDMGQGALLQAWNGAFVNTGEMWINRGEPQIAQPAGPPIVFDGKPLTARLTNSASAWPDSISWKQFQVKGYSIGQDGYPVFHYDMDGVQIDDRLEGYTGTRRLVRTVSFKAAKTRENLWMHLASGKNIIQKDTGEYIVSNRTYYLEVIDAGGLKPQVVETEGGQDLRIRLLAGSLSDTIEYAVIW